MKGSATLPQGNQEPLVVKDKIGRHPRQLGLIKCVECEIFPSVLRCCRLGDRKGIWPVRSWVWFVGGDILTGALHVL